MWVDSTRVLSVSSLWANDQMYYPIEVEPYTPGWDEDAPGKWVKLTRTFRDGHSEIWWALEAQGGLMVWTSPVGWSLSQRIPSACRSSRRGIL